MALETIKQVLMRRDNMSAKDANELIRIGRQMVEDGEDPEDVLMDEFGLELDYAFDLLLGE